MNLRQWSTNLEKIRKCIPANKQETKQEARLLGLWWNTATDTIHLQPPKLIETKKPTLRIIIKNAARVFEPLGIVAPITICAKIISQHRPICSLQLELDDKLPPNIVQEWKALQNDYKRVPQISIARHLPCNEMTTIHAISDASHKAYGFSIYQRVEFHDHIEVNLVFAKARVAPTCKLMIPKLELSAATTATHALKFIANSIASFTTIPMTLWCDSKCTLSRIHSTKILPTFEEHCVQKIRQLPNLQCRYVPSSSNPADHALEDLALIISSNQTGYAVPNFWNCHRTNGRNSTSPIMRKSTRI